MNKVVIAADHGGIEQKEYVKKLLEQQGVPFEDLGGNDPTASDDYPDYVEKLTKKIDENTSGILICGSGTGMAIAANKVPGIRAALGFDEYSAKMARYDNNANVLCLRAREFEMQQYDAIVHAWLTTNFSEIDRHKRRLQKVEQMECR